MFTVVATLTIIKVEITISNNRKHKTKAKEGIPFSSKKLFNLFNGIPLFDNHSEKEKYLSSKKL